VRAVSELEGELGEIVGRARRVGTATGRRSGRRLPIFSSVRGRKRYRILARPVTGNRHAIVAITPQLVEEPAAIVEEPASAADEPPPEDPQANGAQDSVPEDGEGEWAAAFTRRKKPPYAAADVEKDVKKRLKRRGTETVTWPEAAVLLKDAKFEPNKAYVYILVFKDGTPFYVGQTAQVKDANDRVKRHIRSFTQARMFVEKICGAKIEDSVFIWHGTISSATNLDVVEDSLIGLLRRSGFELQQDRMVKVPFQAAGDVVIHKVVPSALQGKVGAGIPGYDGTSGTLKIEANQWFEV
jgi:hypothetical protein